MTGAARSDRLAAGGLVDRDRPVEFHVDGHRIIGCSGDTVASAMLANGILRVADSTYLGRPRGVVAAGVEEPNALVRLRGDYDESMLAATTVEARDGLDVSLLSGIGVLDQRTDPARYDTMNRHTDVAVVGAGPAGLAAARAAAATGARVVLFEQDFALGGSLLGQPDQLVEGVPASEWVDAVRAELDASPEVTVLTRTSVLGSYDGNYLVALETRDPQFTHVNPDVVRQRVWHVRASQVVLATGALERLVVVERGDLPGVMLASAVQTYLGRFAVLPGRNAVVFTTNDSAYATAHALRQSGAEVTVVDAREASVPSAARDEAVASGLEVRSGSAVVAVDGESAVEAVWVAPIDGLSVRALEHTDRQPESLGADALVAADLLAVSGGWNPTLHLHSQRQGRIGWDESLVGFVPEESVDDQHIAGAVAGTYWTDGCLAEGRDAGESAASAAGFGDEPEPTPVAAERPRRAGPTRALWIVPGLTGRWDEHVVDLQRDQTAADVLRAMRAGMRSVEHVKRYTSIGTGADQGKLSGVSTIGVLTSALAGEGESALSPGDLGTTTFRAPYTPVAFAALAGRRRGDLFDVARTTPAHSWHLEHDSVFEDVGQWKRPRYYPLPGEDMDAAVARECRAAREGVAFMDATTLGKIEIRGADAPEFLNRIYTNAFAKLAVGKGRYGVMCTADGMVIDDGVTLRLADDRFLMTTTTGGAATVLDWLEEWSQTEWPDLDVTMTSVTEQWATTAIVGPRSREVVERLAPDLDVSREAFGFMEFRETVLASGIPARVCRISFSGELAFEINVATWFGHAVWEDVAAAGADLGITPYGTETMHVLRAEKAFPIVGQDTDGTVTPQDLGMDWVVSTKKEFIGNRSYTRRSHTEGVRKQLVSLLPADRALRLPEGAQLVEADALGDYTGIGLPERPVPMLGHVTSSYHSAALGRSFALALVKDGRNRVGDTVLASFGGTFAEVVVAEPVLYDPEGARRDG